MSSEAPEDPEIIQDSNPQKSETETGAGQGGLPSPNPTSHWSTLETSQDLKKALRDLAAMTISGRLEPAKAKETRANLESQLRFALAKERGPQPRRKRLPPNPTTTPKFRDLEDTEALAIEVAHREIARLSSKEALSRADARTLEIYTRLITASKVLAMREYTLKRRLGQPDPETGRQMASGIVPSDFKNE